MFDHEGIQKYAIDEIPLDQDIYLMDEVWLETYESSLIAGLSGEEWTYPGYISHAAARSASKHGVELSWYPNTIDRFHEVHIQLPASAFVVCVGAWEWDEKPRIFVRSDWYADIHRRTNSVFAIVDAVGVKDALSAGLLDHDKLARIRDMVDAVAERYPNISFISFADSILLKGNWTIGSHDTEIAYTYDPEVILGVLPELASGYRDVAGLEIYAVVTQGRNEISSELVHVSKNGNHISLNSLGLPFAQLQAIEYAARQAIRAGDHHPFQLYMDATYFNSLRWNYDAEKHLEPRFPYIAPMSDAACEYICSNFGRVLGRLRPKS